MSIDHAFSKPSGRPPADTSAPAVYVVRLPEPSNRFAWEIRRLGAIVVERSRQDFATADFARVDGRTALAALTAATRLPLASAVASTPP